MSLKLCMHASIQTTKDAENLEIAKSMQVEIQNQKQKYALGIFYYSLEASSYFLTNMS